MNESNSIKKTLLILVGLILFIGLIQAQNFSAKSKKYSFSIGATNFVPPILSIKQDSVIFIDENDNKILDPFEEAFISLNIVNDGEGDAQNFKVSIVDRSGIEGLILPDVIDVGIIPSKSEKNIKIPLCSDMGLSANQANCDISFSERNGFGPPPLNIQFLTSEFKEPRLRIVDFSLGESIKEIKRNSTFELNLLVQNVGEGRATDITLNIDRYDPVNTFLINGEPVTAIKDLDPGDTTLVTYSMLVNNIYPDNTLPLEFKINERYKRYGEIRTIDLGLDQTVSTSTLRIQAQGDRPGKENNNINVVQLGIDVDRDIPQARRVNQDTYALIIGNENYTDYQPTLTSESNVDFARRDAEVFAEYCNKTLGIPKGFITVVTDALSSQMRREIERLMDKAQYEGDDVQLILYYSGHGYYDDDQESYIMPVDISGDQVKSGIKLTKLYSDLITYPCNRVTVFIDACFSGGGRNQGLVKAKAVKIAPKENTVNGNIVVFTASSGNEESLFYKEKKHGLFTYFLLKKMQESKGSMSYGDLFDYLRQRVPFVASDQYYKTQNPQVLFSTDVGDDWRKWKF